MSKKYKPKSEDYLKGYQVGFQTARANEIKYHKQALIPPTVEQVCEILSNYREGELITYDKEQNTFYNEDGMDIVSYFEETYYIKEKPEVFALLGRFYKENHKDE